MAARLFWSATGVVGTLLVMKFIDKGEQEAVRASLDKLNEATEQRFEALENRVDANTAATNQIASKIE